MAGGAHQSINYDAQNRTQTVNDQTNGNSATYRYDADGNLLLQRDHTSTGTTVKLYVAGEQLTLTVGTATVSGRRYYSTSGGPTEIRSSAGNLDYEYAASGGTHTVTIDSRRIAGT